MGNNSEMNMINKLIEELNHLDKGSTQYRYPFNNKDNRIVEYTTPPILIDVYILKERMMQLYHYFEGINHLSRIKK